RDGGGAGSVDRREVTEPQAMLVELLARGVAAWLDRKKLVRVEFDLETGRVLQAGFLPKGLPQAPGWEMAPHFRPALDARGDFYDALLLPCGLLVVMIGDVCDKGVGSALFMAMFRSLLRAFAEQAAAFEPSGLAGEKPSTSGPAATELRVADRAEHITRAA